MAESSSGAVGGNTMTYSQFKKSRQSLKDKVQQEQDAKKEGFVQHVEAQGCEYEQHISIIKNPSPGSGSLTHFAFPELHPNARLKAEHEYLLLVSRTRTDEQGRRHSVAVPVIPPAPGVMFEGGYHIEKNPINGAAVLVPPKGMRTRKSKSVSFKKKPEKKLSLSTVEEGATNGAAADARAEKNTTGQESPRVLSVEGELEKLQIAAGDEDSSDPLKCDDAATVAMKKQRERARDLKRSDSRKKMRKQGFLHFLNHSIAH